MLWHQDNCAVGLALMPPRAIVPARGFITLFPKKDNDLSIIPGFGFSVVEVSIFIGAPNFDGSNPPDETLG